jgi:hypothetical protein|nr:MAG TPA: hypothetical protein [Caudoviricetes sp.]
MSMTKAISFRRSEKKMFDFLLSQGDYSYYLKELLKRDENYLQYLKETENESKDMSIQSQSKSNKPKRKISTFVAG